MNDGKEFSSFRDPSGVVFTRDGVLLRQINRCYAPKYDHLMSSGLYDRLTKEGLLIDHAQEEGEFVAPEGFKLIRPTRIPFISYPVSYTHLTLPTNSRV